MAESNLKLEVSKKKMGNFLLDILFPKRCVILPKMSGKNSFFEDAKLPLLP